MSGQINDPFFTEGQTGRESTFWTQVKRQFSEGQKRFRVSNFFLKGFFLLLVVVISGVQLYLGSNHDVIVQSDSGVGRPMIEVLTNQAAPPEMMTEERASDLSASRKKKATGAGDLINYPHIERIQAIRLTDASRGIPAGSEVKGILKSGGANGMVKVETTDPLTIDGDQVLPTKTVLMGQGTSSDERLFINFSRAITPDMSQIKIHALAFDNADRVLGLKGKKLSNYAFQLAAGSALLFLGGMADGMRSDNSTSPFEKHRTTARDAALNGVTVATGDLSHDVMEGMRNQQARVEVAHSTPLIIIFGETDARE